MNYTRLSLSEVRAALLDVARDTQATFGKLSVRQLNWRQDDARWSVAQCFEHLHAANQLTFRAAGDALSNPPTSVLQRVPILPRIVGGLMIRSQAPDATRKFSAPTTAQPTTSRIAGDILHRFIDQQRDAAERVGKLDEREASRKIMISPFVHGAAYSVLDGFRLVVAHDHRHFQQARRVMSSPEFPKS